ncbi:MAG: hypothetical protein V1872_01945 [bacterium]
MLSPFDYTLDYYLPFIFAFIPFIGIWLTFLLLVSLKQFTTKFLLALIIFFMVSFSTKGSILLPSTIIMLIWVIWSGFAIKNSIKNKGNNNLLSFWAWINVLFLTLWLIFVCWSYTSYFNNPYRLIQKLGYSASRLDIMEPIISKLEKRAKKITPYLIKTLSANDSANLSFDEVNQLRQAMRLLIKIEGREAITPLVELAEKKINYQDSKSIDLLVDIFENLRYLQHPQLEKIILHKLQTIESSKSYSAEAVNRIKVFL